jgi:ribonuclease-3
MGLRGLPALKRAVPVRLFQKVVRQRSRLQRKAGNSLLGLIQELPPALRVTALTHSSRAVTRVQSNERLEFLGDSVLGLAIAAELYRRYPESEEGDLARLKAYVVSRANCADVAERLGVGALMEAQAQGSESGRCDAVHSRAVVGNALEALIGAVFLTHGFEQTRIAVGEAFHEQIRRGAAVNIDSKTTLQELLAHRGIQPEYRLTSESGPAHARIFCSEVCVEGMVRGFGTGTTIKMSEQAAAKRALMSYGVDVGAD